MFSLNLAINSLKKLHLIWFSAPLNGFAFWFDVEFGTFARVSPNADARPDVIEDSVNFIQDTSQSKKRANPSNALLLSTAPEHPQTHWQQVIHPF